MSKLISLFDISSLIEPLAAGQLLLTPNQRLASRIRSAYAMYCHEQGHQVVQAPSVYSLNNWIEHNWQSLLFKPGFIDYKLLSAAQEQVIWENIVEDSLLATALLRPAATAQQAISAYRTMVDWRQDFSSSELRAQFESDEDCSVFLSWVDEFEQLCAEKQWLPSAKRPECLITFFDSGQLKQVNSIIGVGFDDISPLHKALICSAGTFTPIKLGAKAEHINVVACENTQQELLSAAVWAKKVLRENANATVALVIADLTRKRQTVQRVLQEVFDPDFNQPGQCQRNLPFNFSAGYPLVEAPVINAALNGLSLSLHALNVDTVIALCQSPFYCLDEQDSESVNRLLSLLYNERDYSISSARLRQLALKVDSKQGVAWHFASALLKQANCARAVSINKARIATQWLPVIQQLLDAIGWPGTRTLNSIEYQQVSQWQQVLEQFSSLDCVLESITFTAAITYLRGMLTRHIFQPQTLDSPLQVLGTLEAAGLEFSHIWLQSMSAQQWPPQPSPNALLPFRLQREQQMPQATAARELEYATRLSQRFIHSAQTVVISYPSIIDENPTRVSTLFGHYESTTVTQLLGRELTTLIPAVEIRRRHIESSSLHDYEPGSAPALTKDEVVSGGSQLFANQSACPFRAFAKHRLGLSALPGPVLGLDGADRGLLLHRALELVWEKLKSQLNLHKQSEQSLQKLSEEVAGYVLTELAQQRAVRLGPRYSKLESLRLQHLLQAWLQIEKQRESFVVESTEIRKTFRFAELTLQTRIDRIDTLADGSLLIIDYKTGNSSISRWWGQRPDEPQLPLYSLLTDNTLNSTTSNNSNSVEAIAFAQIRIDGCVLKGVGSEQLPEPLLQWQDKIKTDAGVENWQQLKQHWQTVLTALAQDFINGNSLVDPKQSPQTCQFCDLASVCRINHQDL